MGRRKKPAAEDVAKFIEEFGIEPTLKPWAIGFEEEIVNQELESDRVLIAQMDQKLKEFRTKRRTMNAVALKELHPQVVDVEREREKVQERYTRRVEIARKCGFTPRVYRGKR